MSNDMTEVIKLLKRIARNTDRIASAMECRKKSSTAKPSDDTRVALAVIAIARGASSFQAARKVAEAVANSTLVKCAWAGNDPNWGRILDAAGYCGVRIREELVDIYYDGVVAVRGGTAAPTPKEKLVAAVTPDKFTVTIDLHQGKSFYTVYTTDLTEKYVELNLSE